MLLLLVCLCLLLCPGRGYGDPLESQSCRPTSPSSDYVIANPEMLFTFQASIPLSEGRSRNLTISTNPVFTPENALVFIKDDAASWALVDWRLRSSAGETGARTPMCVDIGSNFGWYTMFMAIGGCRVKMFEIQLDYVAIATHSIYLNEIRDKIDIYHVGLSDYMGINGINGAHGSAYLNYTHQANGLVSSDSVRVYPGFKCIEKSTVDEEPFTIGTVNDYSARGSAKMNIDFIKIDVEGFEIRTLRGISSLIRDAGVESLLVEVGPSRWRRASVGVLEGINELHRVLGNLNAYLIWRRSGSCGASLFASPPTGSYPIGRGRLVCSATQFVPVRWGRQMTELLFRMNSSGSDCDFWFDKGKVPYDVFS